MIYQFLSSRDSLDTYPNNVWYDFTIDLPGTLEVDATWECALLDINCIPQIQNQLIVYADIVKQSFIRDTTASVLRVVHFSDSDVTLPYYIPVNRGGITQVRISIRDLETGQVPTESVSLLTCTLGYRKRKKNYGS